MDRLTNTVERLAECHQRLNVLLDRLAGVVKSPPEQVEAASLTALLDEILENLDEQFRLEEDNDYMADVLERYPTWYPQVRQLQEEHRLLQRHLREVQDRIARENAGSTLSREIHRQLRDWLNAYRNHDRRENDLVQEAFTLDVGAGE